MARYKTIPAKVLCRNCGTRGEHHREKDGRCPATKGWGNLSTFPRWSNLLDDVEAGRKFDETFGSTGTTTRPSSR